MYPKLVKEESITLKVAATSRFQKDWPLSQATEFALTSVRPQPERKNYNIKTIIYSPPEDDGKLQKCTRAKIKSRFIAKSQFNLH